VLERVEEVVAVEEVEEVEAVEAVEAVEEALEPPVLGPGAKQGLRRHILYNKYSQSPRNPEMTVETR
jgi:hypothetical protein